jgi:hypothetical protein
MKNNSKNNTEFYTYDIETYPNFFSIILLPLTRNQILVDKYIETDIQYINTDSGDIEKENLWKLKTKLWEAMGIKIFTIFRDKDNPLNIIDNSQNIVNFIANNSYKCLFGYNSYNFDSNLLDSLLFYKGNRNFKMNYTAFLELWLYEEAQMYIKWGREYRNSQNHVLKKVRRVFEDRDLQKIMYLDKSFTSLKQVAVSLKWHRLQELPIEAGRKIEKQDIRTILDYNVNDVLITDAMLWECYNEVTLRDEITNMYNMNVKNDSRSSIGNKLMIKTYSEITGLPPVAFKSNRSFCDYVKLNEIISDKIQFETPFFIDILEYLKTRSIKIDTDSQTAEPTTTKYKTVDLKKGVIYVPKNINESYLQFNKIEFMLDSNRYTLGKGGLHTRDEAGIFLSNENEKLIDADVTSYYPSIIINFDISPRHLAKGVFVDIVRKYRDDRVVAKKNKDTVKAEALKIVINRIYGSLADINDMNYDPQALYSVTLNGELSLLMLIESLYLNKIQILSVNTDGILCKVKKSDIELYNDICKKWQDKTNFALEFTEYEKYVRRDVNAYIALKTGYYSADNKENYIKYKNLFDPAVKLEKGYKYPVINIALVRYFVNNIPIKETVKNHIKSSKFAIYDYCISQKVGKSFKIVYRRYVNGEKIESEAQYTNRYYVCTKNGGYLVKLKTKQEISLIAEQVQIFNNYKFEENYNIDFNYYIKIVQKLLYGEAKTKKVSDFGIVYAQSKLF